MRLVKNGMLASSLAHAGQGGVSLTLRQRRLFSPIHLQSSSGFTLIELLIVLLIISIVTSVAMLTFGRNSQRDIKTFATELSQLMQFAQDRALLEEKVLGVKLTEDHIYFVYLTQDKHKNLIWRPYQDQTLHARKLPSTVQLAIHLLENSGPEDEEHAKESVEEVDEWLPQILIYSNRELTPFKISIGMKDDKPHYALLGDTDGSLQLKTLG